MLHDNVPAFGKDQVAEIVSVHIPVRFVSELQDHRRVRGDIVQNRRGTARCRKYLLAFEVTGLIQRYSLRLSNERKKERKKESGREEQQEP